MNDSQWNIISFDIFVSKIFNIINKKKLKTKNTVLGNKRYKKSYPIWFVIRDPRIVGGFICYFELMTILSSQNLRNVNYRFGLQKGVEKHIRYVFLIRDLQIIRGFISYF